MRLRSLAVAAVILVAAVLSGCSGTLPHPVDSASCAPASGLEPGTSTSLAVTVAGEPRSYRVHVPAEASAMSPAPVILAFTGYQMPTERLEQLSDLDDGGAVVIYPEPARTAAGEGWQGAPYSSGADDVAFTSALIDDVESRMCIDSSRVFAAGISNGGGFVSLLSCALPDRIAAFAIISGAVYPADNPPCSSAPPVPVVEFHGTGDDVIPYDGGTRHGASLEPVPTWLSQVATRNGCETDPRSTTISGGVEEQTWIGCRDRGALVHHRIDGGGHVWPGAAGSGETSISATDVIEAFFAAHPLT